MDLVLLAEKYENKEFLEGDPSWFMHQVEGESNREILAFIASCLSYGSRKQFIPKIRQFLDWSNGNITSWLSGGQYKMDIPLDDACFYRLYTNSMMRDMLSALRLMHKSYGSMKGYLLSEMKTKDCLEAISLITTWFESHGSKGIVPKSFQYNPSLREGRGLASISSCKRICMFLRWMVRTDSPVDLGIWSDVIDKTSLIIPMDTHVVQEANRLGLLTTTTTSMKSAINLTSKLAEVFPDDPLKGDFALFGLGVDKTS